MLAQLDEALTRTVERLSESTVTVRSLRLPAPSLRRFQPLDGEGTGLLVDRRGYVVTNHHVVEGATRIETVLSDGRSFVAEVAGQDERTDLAVLRIDAGELPEAPLGDSEALKVGQLVVALGNSLGLPGSHTASVGVISALGRPLPGSDFVWEGLLQTDAAINPGNSGGPLATLDGKVVGINTAMVPFAQGVGFAIPIHAVRRVLEQIIEKGRVSRPWMGISAVSLQPSLARRLGLTGRTGALIAEVEKGSPADRGGLRRGDLITGIAGQPIDGMRSLVKTLGAEPLGREIPLSYVRAGKESWISLRMEEAPPPAA